MRVELHAGARYRRGPDPASGTDVALARSHSHGRRLRHRRAAPRRASRAIGRRRRGRLHRRRHQSYQFVSPQSRDVQPVRPRCGLSLWLRRRQRELRVSHRLLHAHLRRHPRGFRQDLRGATGQRAEVSVCADAEAADARGVSERAHDRRSAAAVRLRHAVRRRRRLSGDAPRARPRSSACPTRAFSRPSSGTTLFPTIRSSIAAAGRSIATSFMRRPESARRTSTCSRPTTIIRSSA